MTLDNYINMCEQLGEEVDWDNAPIEIDDFPDYVIYGIEIFNCLPDTYSGGMEPIYTGKDLGSFSTIAQDIFQIDKDEYKKVFSIVMFLDQRARNKAIAKANKKGNK